MEQFDIDNIEMILISEFGEIFLPEKIGITENRLIYKGTLKNATISSLDKLIKRFREAGYNVEIVGIEPNINLIFSLSAYKNKSESKSKGRKRYRTHILLFLLTFITTLFAGVIQYDINFINEPSKIWLGLTYAIPILMILLAHEMGHYLMSRHYNVEATLPYFIPFPSIFGTMGAVIKMKSPIPDKDALIDIGMAGPLAGMAVVIPVLIIGLMLSKTSVSAPAQIESGIMLGESLLFKSLSWIIHGPLPENKHLIIHPTAFAGWVGLLVTFMNLFPASQLDGGHISYAIFGPLYKTIGKITCLIFAILSIFFYWPWIVWLIIILFIGLKHPSPIDDTKPISKKRKILGFICFGIFILTFIPQPFYGPDMPVDIFSILRALK